MKLSIPSFPAVKIAPKMEKVTIRLHTDDPSPVQKTWIVYNSTGQFVGFIRKFKDTAHDTSPFQVFDSANKDFPKVVAEFWKASVDLTGMNRNKHRFGGYVEAARYAREYFGGKLVTVIND